ncbi:16168_t:CDS:10 [Acaulospora colombiana]|uniref:16168_t:CDS:1 n=1 Tax=Acaulospora colombiana TaxID=27376 RepID=A0ACA9M8A7_9GLOM|nr:16168_t:CDS:10 [Acaulospora colombiana]
MSSESSEENEIDENEIDEFFKSYSKWSLLGFLQYRQVQDDFSYVKLREYKLYESSLEKLSNDYARQRLKYVPANEAVTTFLPSVSLNQELEYVSVTRDVLTNPQSEKNSLAVKKFWMMVGKKRLEIEIEQLNYANCKRCRVRNVTTNESMGTRDHARNQEEVNSGEEELANDSRNYLREPPESMAKKVERIPLTVNDIDFEKIFIDYRDKLEDIFDDIMDMRPTSRFANEISEESWVEFVTSTYPEHDLPEDWEGFILEFFKPKDSLGEWIKGWRELLSPKINGNKIPKDLADAIHNILTPYLEVPVQSSKYRLNANINPITDEVLEAECTDGLARLWPSREEVFLYEQTGPPNFDDIKQLYIHDHKLIRLMKDVLNQRSFMKESVEVKRPHVEPKQMLLIRRLISMEMLDRSTTDEPKKRKLNEYMFLD